MTDTPQKAVLVWLVLVCCTSARAADATALKTGEEFFENKIRPVLVQRCFKCHAVDHQEGKLRLDRRDHALQGGQSGRVLIPGDANASLLIRAIRRVDKSLQMPPEDQDQLTPEEIQNFVDWVKMGVPFPGNGNGDAPLQSRINLAEARKFWSFQPPQAVIPPDHESADTSRSPIDQFVKARLKVEGMKGSSVADRRTLLRRVTYDLTGLPPRADEIDAFLADASPDAFAKAVDRLLESPQYGVHWGRHWLDVARYGDTRWVGAGEDRRWPFAFTYRDWVIKALNEDMSYNRFVTLQLAADQVSDARQADKAALGFLTVGRWFTGTLPDVIDDQIDVVTRGLLGMSAQCARCHDHKFDPISAQDYYSLYGVFAAGRMPVDGTGVVAQLPDVDPLPVEPAVEQEIATLRGRVDQLLNNRLTEVRARFRTPEMLSKYMAIAETLLDKQDNDIRASAKSQELDEQLLMRWVRYLKNTTRNPHLIFSAWHALAALPETDFAARAMAVIETEKAGKLNKHVAEMLNPVPASLAEVTQRYVDLFLKFDGPETISDFDRESIRQVLRNNDSPVQLPTNELGPYLSADEKEQMVELRRSVGAKLAVLPERADHFLTYQHEAEPILKEINDFLEQRRVTVAADLKSADKLANYLLTARESEATSDSKFRSLVRSRQLSERQVRRWIEYLQQASQIDDRVFSAWRVYASATEHEFTEQSAPLAERARNASGNPVVADLFVVPPTTLSEVAKRYAELILRFATAEPFADADYEAVRQVSMASTSPLRFSANDVMDYFTQKDQDELRNKERNLTRLYLESPGTPARAMILGDSSRSYAQRVFVRGNPNIPGESSHGGFFAVFSEGDPRPFSTGRGRLDLAQSIVDSRNPLAARVIVNRVWQWHFGTGLVSTPSDFGARGSKASHPELLDWLAQQFIADGWSLKKLHRRILLSATWQQSSEDIPANRAIDPDNRLLWRMNRRRLGFEETRDSLLAATERLDRSVGGRPSDLTRNIVRRRTVFGTVDRVSLPGFYRYFDFPGADAHVAERQETIVAQQALYLMNNSFVMEQAAHVARLTANQLDPAARIDRMYRLILGRSPVDVERTLGLEFVASAAVDPAPASTATSPSVPASAAGTTTSPDAWQYGCGTYDEGRQRTTEFFPFPFVANNQYRGGPQDTDPIFGRASLHGHGGNAGVSNEMAAVRRWVAPRHGRISIEGLVSCQANAIQPSGDGIRARIVSNRHGQLGVWLVQGTDEKTDRPGIAVEQGDTIDFITDARGRETTGGFAWSILVRMEPTEYSLIPDATAPVGAKEQPISEKLVWDAGKDFKATAPVPPQFDIWGRYAQVLLESNEFLFLD